MSDIDDEFERVVMSAIRDVQADHGTEAADVFVSVLHAYAVSSTLTQERAVSHLHAVQRGEWAEVAERLAE